MSRNKRAERKPPRIVAVGADGSRHEVEATGLELLFDDGRRLTLCFPQQAWGEVEIEAEAAGADDTPVISLQAAACNALSLRVELLQGLLPVQHEAPVPIKEAAPVPASAPLPAPCTLKLTVQKALEAGDRANAPKKNHIRRWAQAALETDAEVTVRLVGEQEGRELNREFRGKDYATNVLTFAYNEGEALPLPDGVPLTGDLVLCVPVVVREALEQGKTLEAHFAHLVVHGMLHLQAYNHVEADEAERMEALERQILQRLGYPDPYA